MLWVYDNSICDDLKNSFDKSVADPVVKVLDPESSISLAAQLADDDIRFPIIAILRNPEYAIDTQLSNFTAMHRGVATVIDPKTNNLYYERSIPVSLNYTLSVIHTNTTDVDELVKELIFKYTSMYFLSIRLPYEGNRKLRFGVEIDTSRSINRVSAVNELLSSGKLYESEIPLVTRGCRLITYVPKHLQTFEYDITALSDEQFKNL